VIDQDSATNPLMEQIALAAGIPFDLDAPRLRGPVRDARYACVTAVARDNARIGVPTILVAPFTAELRDADAHRRLAEAVAPGVLQLVLVAPRRHPGSPHRGPRGRPRPVGQPAGPG
jgi:hypothetical protein